MLDAWNLILPNVGCLKWAIFFIAYKLNNIVIGYKQDLCKFENYQFTK